MWLRGALKLSTITEQWIQTVRDHVVLQVCVCVGEKESITGTLCSVKRLYTGQASKCEGRKLQWSYLRAR